MYPMPKSIKKNPGIIYRPPVAGKGLLGTTNIAQAFKKTPISSARYSVAVGNVDSDIQQEIVTGGHYVDGSRIAQLCVWD